MRKCVLDTETCGLHGLAVILQYAYDDGPIVIHEFWHEPIEKTLRLIEEITQCCVIGFNLAFDWFHLCKIYTTFSLYHDHSVCPKDIIDEIAILEEKARDGPCLKPADCFDLMLHARKTEYQITMERSTIRIRRVPVQLASRLAKYLEENIHLEGILFARSKNKLSPRWKVQSIDLGDGMIDPNFKNVVLKFQASAALKALAIDALKIPEEEILRFSDIEVDRAFWPKELGYAPFALAIGSPGAWNGAWPEVIRVHINHWHSFQRARKYAANDVDYTRRLYEYFGCPPTGDNDSVLACMVATVRWRGYKIDIEGIKELRKEAVRKSTLHPTSPRKVRRYLEETLDDIEKLGLRKGTGKVILEEIKNDSKGLWDDHPIKERAIGVLEARMAKKEIELYDKLLIAGRFHVSLKVIGTLSSRMAGADKLNAHGIKKTKQVRSKFPLAWDEDELQGGDFSAFEIVLADAAYGDLDLRRDLLTKRPCHKCKKTPGFVKDKKTDQMITCDECKGTLETSTKIHALFGMEVYPDMTYEQIMESSGTSDDKYTRSKSAVFAMLYGGEGYTLMTRLGVDKETADAAYLKFINKYRQVGIERRKIYNSFCSMRQEGGIGSRIVWSEPADYIESLLGFRRYFTLENRVCRTLFELAQSPPESWRGLKVKVRRREDREQTVLGALQSALFGCAFQIQAANMRAAANHVIQSSGAQITKHVQRKIWDLQPIGVSEFKVQPVNIHDEVLTPTKKDYVNKVRNTVKASVESFRDKVPLIEMEWGRMTTWADK